MQVDTYSTRNFATLGHSGLMPPFARTYIQSLHLFISFYRTGQASDLIHHFTILQSPVFLLNSRRSQLFITRTLIANLKINKSFVLESQQQKAWSSLSHRLQSEFAEFLKYYSLIHFSTLILTHLCRSKYGNSYKFFLESNDYKKPLSNKNYFYFFYIHICDPHIYFITLLPYSVL